MAGSNEISRKEIEILRILSELMEPVGSTFIKRELEKRGFFLSERTIRYHLKMLELRGLVSGHEKGGRTITEKGLEELSRSLVSQRIGFVITRFLSMTYSVIYDPATTSGLVITNISIADKNSYERIIETVNTLYETKMFLAPN